MKKVAIIGAGISGLFIANLFKKSPNFEVTVFEKRKSNDIDDGYGIQLSVNSINLLNKIRFNLLDERKKFNPDKIKFYSGRNLKKICELNIADFNNFDCKYTTLKRSELIKFLKEGISENIMLDHSISKIDQQDNILKIYFENKKVFECDYVIVSDGVFSKSKSLISNYQNNIMYNDTLAIRGNILNQDKFDNDNISIFLGSNYHFVVYPVDQEKLLNFIAIIKFKLSRKDQKNYSLFSESSFIEKVLNKIPIIKENFYKLHKVKIFPVYVSKNFNSSKIKNIYFIGDAFFAFPPSFAQGASQSIEGAYELFKSMENNSDNNFHNERVKRTKMVNNRSKLNQYIFHISNPFLAFIRNIILKKLVNNKLFLKSYLGRIYKN